MMALVIRYRRSGGLAPGFQCASAVDPANTIDTMKKRFISGTSTTRPSHGEAPASAALRTLNDRAIQRNGRLQRNQAAPSHSGAGCTSCARTLSSGFTNCSGLKNTPTVVQIAPASTAYLIP